jgi:hypothetical protein
MRYFDGVGVRMHSDIAYRLGHVLNTYLKQIDVNDVNNFSSTLALSILETILCNFVEQVNNRDYKKEFKNGFGINLNTKINESSNILGIKSGFILETSYPNTTYFNFLKNIRNSLSHPFNYSYNINISLKKCLENKNELLHTGIFTQFDDILYNKNNLITDYYFVTTSRKENESGNLIFNYNIYKISSDDLIKLTLKLCELMSQPVINDWKDFNKDNYKTLFVSHA